MSLLVLHFQVAFAGTDLLGADDVFKDGLSLWVAMMGHEVV